MNDRPLPAESAPRTVPAVDPQVPGDLAQAAAVRTLLDGVRSAVITAHERPDGDSIGSTVGLCLMLRGLGIDAQVVMADAVPERYLFLDPQRVVRRATPGESFACDLFCVLDSTDLTRLGSLRREQFSATRVLNIDHHLNNPNFGTVNLVDTSAAATAELVWRLAAASGWNATLPAFQALYAGLVTDTGQFSYTNASPRVLRMAALAIEAGVNPHEVWRRIYASRSAPELALEARARASLACGAGGRICTVSIGQADFAATGTGPQHTEEFVNIPRSLAGVELALFFCEVEAGRKTKVSLRSTGALDAAKLAGVFGGGGHRQASGCSLPLPLAEARERVMQEAEKAVVALWPAAQERG